MPEKLLHPVIIEFLEYRNSDSFAPIVTNVKCKNILYDKDTHPLLLLNISAEGGSINEFCALARITRLKYDIWEREYRDFQDAAEYANTLRTAWWERHGRTQLENPNFNTNLYKSQMKHLKIYKDDPLKDDILDKMINITPERAEALQRFITKLNDKKGG